VPLTISVGGKYTQGPGGTLALGIGGLQREQYDHVQVGGNASLNGTLAVSSLNNFRPVTGNAFEVLHTNGSRSGQFAQVNDFLNNNPNLQRVDIYASNAVVLLYEAATTPAPTPKPTPPGPAPSPTPNPRPPIDIIVPGPLPPVDPEEPIQPKFLLSFLDPTVEQLTSMFEIPFSGANTQRFNLTDRMTQIQQGSTGFVSPIAPAPAPIPTGKEIGKKEVVPPALVPGPTNRWGVWVNGWGDWVNVNDDNGAKGYDFTTGGVSVGVDYRITDNLAVGIFGTYAHTWTDFRPGDGDVNTGRGGLYATYWDPQGWWVNAGIWGGYNSYSTSRQALLGQANGSTSGYEFSTFGDAGYDFHCGDLTFGPIVSMQYTDVHVNGFSENGSLVPLAIHGDSEDSLRTDVGGRAYYNWHLGKMLIIPSLTIAWEHEYLYSNLPITASAPELGGATATFNGPNEGHDSLLINAGAGVQWTPRISTYIGYQGQLGRDNYNANGVTGTISFSF
jgi:outer membrane autotransporter protein